MGIEANWLEDLAGVASYPNFLRTITQGFQMTWHGLLLSDGRYVYSEFKKKNPWKNAFLNFEDLPSFATRWHRKIHLIIYWSCLISDILLVVYIECLTIHFYFGERGKDYIWFKKI